MLPLFSRNLPFAWDCLRCVLPTGETAMCAWEESSEPSLPSGTSASRGETPPRRGRPPSPGKCRSATSEHRPLPEATLTGPHARRGTVTATNCAHPPCGSTAARRADAAAAGAEARPLEAPWGIVVRGTGCRVAGAAGRGQASSVTGPFSRRTARGRGTCPSAARRQRGWGLLTSLRERRSGQGHRPLRGSRVRGRSGSPPSRLGRGGHF